MSGGKRVNPEIERYFYHSVKDEVAALLLLLRYQWYLVLMLVVGVGWLMLISNPWPPRTIRVAVGQPNSTLEVVAKKYAAHFDDHDVKLELVRSNGAIENLELLKAGKVDVAFSQGGAPVDDDAKILSLGSIGYQPLWFFHRGQVPQGADVLDYIVGKRISIAMPGSGTRLMVDSVLNAIPQEGKSRSTFVELSAAASTQALFEGRIDGMFLLAGMESGNLNALLEREDIGIMSFPCAKAMTRFANYAEVVSVPRGALSLSPARPSEDIQMIATTTTIMVSKDLHPAIQYLFLEASSAMYREESVFFDRAKGFPAFVDKSSRKSKVAQRYYQSGPAVLENYAPFWVASFFDRAWFSILAALAVIYPLFRLLPRYRVVMFEVVMSNAYTKIYHLYQSLEERDTLHAWADAQREYLQLKAEIESYWVPKGCKEAYGSLLNTLHLLKAKLDHVELSYFSEFRAAPGEVEGSP